MLFNSIDFMLFFPIVVLTFFIIPKRARYIWLLLASYYFYMSWNPKYAALIAISTVITWLSGILLEKYQKEDRLVLRKYIVGLSFFLNLSILFFFKYFDFVLENLNYILSKVGVSVLDRPFDVLLPVGISFYTFQALSYTVDVFRGDVRAEKSLLKYALFVSFFPQLVAGPIERSGNLLRQIQELDRRELFEYKRITNGLIVMLWGFFLKMVLADRIAILVNCVFDSYYMYHSLELIIAAVGFAIQIYCDFASYSVIAIGAAQVMGFTLMENFDVPYFSRSIKEFWRRWHISLSTWFRDYLYIPLGGNRCSKRKKYRNLMITFLISGLWHGANWTYVIWGGIHGLYQILGEELAGVKKKANQVFHTRTESFSYKFGQTIITFLLVDFAWIFFRSNTIKDALYYMIRIFTKWNPWAFYDGTLYRLGLNRFNVNVLIVSLFILLLVDMLKYFTKLRIDDFLQEQCIWFRWGVLLLLIMSILIYGVYGPAYDAQQFIYFQF